MTDPNLRWLLDISRMGSDHESRHFAFLKRESLFKPEEIEKNKLHLNTIESQLCDLGVQVIQGNRIKKPPSFCIRQCSEDIFTTMLTAGGNKWGIVCKKVAQSLSKSCICH